MQIQAIVDLINFKLAGEMLSIRETLPHMDDVITDINDRLNTIFPYVSDVHAAGNTEYTAFPDKYLRSVVVLGAAHYFYVTDEEGGLEDAGYYTKYQNALFVMERDYLTLVPDEYKACNLQGTTPFNLTGAVGYGIYDFPLSRKDPRLAPYYSGGACPDGGSSGGQVNDPLPIGYGGTSANNAADARHLLGADNADNIVQGTLNISHGGTGANNAQDARRTLGANDANNINRGTLAIENGGTNATTAAGARDNLGLTNLENFTEGVLPIAQGGTGATTLTEAKSNLGIQNINLPLALSDGGTGSSSVATARANLGADNAGNITKGVLPIAHGGTGAATIAEAKASLNIPDPFIDAPNNGLIYARRNAAWQQINSSGGGLPEAPEDGKQYARQDGDWSEIVNGGGGGGRTAALIIASSNSSEASKASADIVIDLAEDTGAIATEQINALLLGGLVQFTEGTFNFRTALYVYRSNLTLQGAGSATRFVTQGSLTTLISIPGNTEFLNTPILNITIKHLYFFSESSNSRCVYFYSTTAPSDYFKGATITNCIFEHSGAAIAIAAPLTTLTISNNRFIGRSRTSTSCTVIAILNSTTANTISDTIITNNFSENVYAFIRSAYLYRVCFKNNQCTRHYYGVLMDTYCYYCLIDGNTYYHNAPSLTISYTACVFNIQFGQNTVVSNNIIDGTASDSIVPGYPCAIKFDRSNQSTNNKAINNKINSMIYGISVNGQHIIDGNYFTNCTAAIMCPAMSIQSTSKLIVNANIILTCDYGIQMQGTASGQMYQGVICGNYIDTSIAGIQLMSIQSTVIRDNTILNTVESISMTNGYRVWVTGNRYFIAPVDSAGNAVIEHNSLVV